MPATASSNKPYTLDDLRDVHQQYTVARTALTNATNVRRDIVRGLLRQGHTEAEVAAVLGLSRGRIGQIVGGTRRVRGAQS